MNFFYFVVVKKHQFYRFLFEKMLKFRVLIIRNGNSHTTTKCRHDIKPETRRTREQRDALSRRRNFDPQTQRTVFMPSWQKINEAERQSKSRNSRPGTRNCAGPRLTTNCRARTSGRMMKGTRTG